MHPQFLAASVSDAGDGVAGTAEADETFCVDVQQITGARPLVQPYLLARLARAPRDPRTAKRPPDRRVGMAGLARDQSRAPAAAKARRADSLLLADRKQPRTSDAAARSDPRDKHPTRDPPSSLRSSDATTYTQSSAKRHDALPLHDTTSQPRRQPRARDVRQVRDEHYGEVPSGSSFDCEPWQTHSLEGDPDDLLSRPQPVEARHLETGPHGTGATATVSVQSLGPLQSKGKCLLERPAQSQVKPNVSTESTV